MADDRLAGLSGQFNSPEGAARFVKVAVYRSTGFVIEGDAEAQVLDQLTTGYRTIDEDDRAAVYGEAVTTYVNNLVSALPRADGSGIEKRGSGSSARPASPMLPETLRTALGSICPLWPFC